MSLSKYDYLKKMEEILSPEDAKELKSIWAPRVVATPLADARTDVCILPTGEIRSYGTVRRTSENPNGRRAYLSSFDCGLSWKQKESRGVMGSCRYISSKNLYMKGYSDESGTYALLSNIGPDDENPRKVFITELPYTCFFLPTESAYTNRIWMTAQYFETGKPWQGAFFYSDDFGESWQTRILPSVPDEPLTYPDKGERWKLYCGCEPIAEELSADTMAVLLRNSTDSFQICYSHDGGDTWTEPADTDFYGHDTTPYLIRLSNGKSVVFWNNTHIFPEQNRKTQIPAKQESYVWSGDWEDVFTNRDAAHAAISEDGGQSWVGYREFLLNPIRNRSDFRYAGGLLDGLDKSVHQHQAWELPFGKIMITSGQNPASRRTLIFDQNWLYETAREEDFRGGLDNISTHLYLKSISGNASETDNGHCSWNRITGAVMSPDPTGVIREAVQISHVNDSRLLAKTQGVVWNFPASRQGTVTLSLLIRDGIARISLLDRWFNCCDDTLNYFAPCTFDLEAVDLDCNGFSELQIQYDLDQPFANVLLNGKQWFRVRMNSGVKELSYLAIQCIADGNVEGTYINSLSKE